METTKDEKEVVVFEEEKKEEKQPLHESYSIYNKDYLRLKNPFSDDDNIVFQEEEHHYICYNKYFEEWFQKLDDECAMGIAMLSTSGVLDSMFYDKYEFIAKMILKRFEQQIKNDPTHRYFGCETVEDVKSRWGGAAHLGTKMHEVFEIYLNLYEQQKDQHGGDPVLTEKYMKELGSYHEIQFLFTFMRKMKIYSGEYSCFRTELKMYDPVLNISGTIDLVMKNNANGKYVIVDWKRSKHALEKPKPIKKIYDCGRFLSEWEKLYNCSLNRYSLQLHIYCHILENVYGFEIEDLFLVVINPDRVGKHDEFTIQQVPLHGCFRDAVDQYCAFRAKFILDGVEDPEAECNKPFVTELQKRYDLGKAFLENKQVKQ